MENQVNVHYAPLITGTTGGTIELGPSHDNASLDIQGIQGFQWSSNWVDPTHHHSITVDIEQLSDLIVKKLGEKERRTENMNQNIFLAQLKTFNENACDLEELVVLLTFGNQLRDTFEAVSVEIPEWLDGQLRKLKREIRSRQADSIDKVIREKEARLEALKPAEKKRAELAAEIKKLKAKQAEVA